MIDFFFFFYFLLCLCSVCVCVCAHVYMYMYLSVCVCVREFFHMCMRANACGGLRLILGIIFNTTSTLLTEAGSYSRAQWSARWLVLLASLPCGAPRLSLLRSEFQVCLHAHSAFMWGLGIQLRSWHWGGKHFNQWAMSQVPEVDRNREWSWTRFCSGAKAFSK